MSLIRKVCRRVLCLTLCLKIQSFSLVMAVDRTKFRTCDQTSFCRRHRLGSQTLSYSYKLMKESVHFHFEPTNVTASETDSEHEAPHTETSNKGVWKTLQRRLLGNIQSASEQDDYLSGPPPTLTGMILNKVDKKHLQWSVTALQKGIVRMRVTEVYGTEGSPHEEPRVTYDSLVLETDQLEHSGHAVWIKDISEIDSKDKDSAAQTLLKKVLTGKDIDKKEFSNFMGLQYGDAQHSESSMLMLIQLEPFVVTLYREAEPTIPIVELGAEQMMHFEVRRWKDDASEHDDEVTEDDSLKSEESEKKIVGYWEDGLAIYADGTREQKQEVKEDRRQLMEDEKDEEGMWEEKFGSHTDSKPYGPMSVGLDISFPGSKHLYGIPEHASSSVLQPTVGADAHYKEPYRLYNLDVFEYELDETMALYGHVPLVLSQSMKAGSVGVFWFNPSETFVDVHESSDRSQTHWISESGILDVFLMPGPDPATLYKQYSILTGTTPLPPMFSLGYHQCRWNYKDEKDVAMVHSKFEELDYPYDVLWLDIEHTNDKRYFTWDKNLFPTPEKMQESLASQGRRMVTIVDPHIKVDKNYYIHSEASAKGLYVKDKDGKKDYDGWCWPGSSSYLDFTDENVRSWWAEQFSYKRYEGSTPTLFTWNDMNEPSVFNGPEVSMQKDLRNLKGEEHREWHNLYGMLFQKATAEGLARRNQPHEDIRPFVLSRAFFAGSQKYGAIWTGDNTAEWGHLVVSTPMLLSLNTAALSFVGADVGGFFGNPDAELFTRWMQAAAYQPFFRGHAHHDSKRREPWMFGEETLVRLRKAAMTRYALLPYWYTVFFEAELSGMPVMRMLWMQYPETETLFALDDQYLVGSDLLVKPVTSEGATEVEVVFPTDHLWYDVETMALTSHKISQHGIESKIVPVSIDDFPAYQRGGSIIARKLRLRRSTMMMKKDPYSLYIALDEHNSGSGSLHMDDEESLNYRKRKEYADATFKADFGKAGLIHNTVSIGDGWAPLTYLKQDRMIERIVVMGISRPPIKLSIVETGRDVDFSYNPKTSVLVVRQPGISALENWTISVWQASSK